jgi:hypothetical protein
MPQPLCSDADAGRAGPAGPRLYRGGCQCGAVHYEARLDLSRSSACSTSVWEQAAEPASFTLLIGEESLTGYQFFAESVHHFFCVRCGVRVFCHHVLDSGDFYTLDIRNLHSRHAPTVGFAYVKRPRAD